MKKTLFGIHGNCRKILKVLSQFVKLSQENITEKGIYQKPCIIEIFTYQLVLNNMLVEHVVVDIWS